MSPYPKAPRAPKFNAGFLLGVDLFDAIFIDPVSEFGVALFVKGAFEPGPEAGNTAIESPVFSSSVKVILNEYNSLSICFFKVQIS